MSSTLKWKVPLILGVLAVSVALSYPPKDRISLGLDLQGGSHLVMQVDTASAVKNETNLAISRIGQALKDKELKYASIASPDATTLELKGSDPARGADVRRVLDDHIGQWAISDQGSGNWRATLSPTLVRQIENAAVDTTLTTLRNRIDELGVKEPVVQKAGGAGDRIVIQLPGVEDPERAKKVLQDPALLEWKAVNYPPGVSDYGNWMPGTSEQETIGMFGGQLPADTQLFPQRFPTQSGGTVTYWWPLNTVSVIIGNDLRTAQRGVDQLNRSVVHFQLSQDAGRRFGAATREYIGKKMAVVLGSSTRKDVVTAPVIRSEIHDSGQIEGNFDVKSAEDLALKLRSGAIPTDVSIIEERTVGPSLGRDSIRSGVLAALAGFLGVMVFMLVYYRLSGVNAVVALALNVVILLGVLAYFGATLTLPGIAGFVLTVGMAVDSNVLIFERIREELGLGKAVRSAIDQGFSRAFATIVDTHVTTLVSALFLFWFGTGPVRGFAVTLIGGLLISMFTAVFVSRVIFDLVLGERRKLESLSI